MKTLRILPILILAATASVNAWAAGQFMIKGGNVRIYASHKGTALADNAVIPEGTVVIDKVLERDGRHRIRIGYLNGWVSTDALVPVEGDAASATVAAPAPQAPVAVIEVTTPVLGDSEPVVGASVPDAPSMQIAEEEPVKEAEPYIPMPAPLPPSIAAMYEQQRKAAREEEERKAAAAAAEAEAARNKVCFSEIPTDKTSEEYAAYMALQSHADKNKIATTQPWFTADKSSGIKFKKDGKQLVMVLKQLTDKAIVDILKANEMITSAMTEKQQNDMVGDFKTGLRFDAFPFQIRQVCSHSSGQYFTMSLVGTGEHVGGVEGNFKLVPLNNGAPGFRVTGEIGGSVINDTFSNAVR